MSAPRFAFQLHLNSLLRQDRSKKGGEKEAFDLPPCSQHRLHGPNLLPSRGGEEKRKKMRRKRYI